MQPIPPGVELQSSVESNDERADEEKSHISNTASWVWSAGGQRDSVMLDADSPDNPRLSRMSTMDNIASEEEVALEMEKVVETDKKAGVTRPPNYTKLGSKLPFRIARTPEDLTPAWMTTVLRFKKVLSDDVSVEAVSTKPIGEGGGVMGVIVLVKLTLSANAPESAPRSMVAKFSPQGKLPIPRFMLRAAFTAESHFYNDFTIADGGMSRPQCYVCLYDKPRRKPTFCMLLEDMMPAVSYTRVGSCSEVEKLHSAVATLAKLHARWWDHPKAPPLDWLLHPTQDYGGLLLNGFMHATKVGLAAMGKCYPEQYKPILAWQPILKRRHKYILNELMRPPLTLTHGDAHIENVFYGERFSGSCAFIDFGNMMFSQGTYDVAFFMAHSLDVEVRRAHEKAVVAHYHEVLLANGVSPTAYPYERCWFDYRFNFWRTLIAVLTMGPNLEKQHKSGTGIFGPSPSEGEQQQRVMYEKLNERIITALLDHEWISLAQEQRTFRGVCSCLPFCF